MLAIFGMTGNWEHEPCAEVSGLGGLVALLACVPRKSLHTRQSKRQHAVQLAASEEDEGLIFSHAVEGKIIRDLGMLIRETG